MTNPRWTRRGRRERERRTRRRIALAVAVALLLLGVIIAVSRPTDPPALPARLEITVTGLH